VKTTRLRVTMREVEPPVVRVLDIPGGATLPEVHDLLQAGIGWTDSHLHLFETDSSRYGIPDPDFGDDDPNHRDERTATLRDLPLAFVYHYDFGDGWEHDIEALGAGGPEPGCIEGHGACPPEDCGGPGGYAEFRTAIADPAHPDHEHLRAWAGPWSDTFDLEATNALVHATAGSVPASVRMVLNLLEGGVRLTPGGRLPRVVVRAVQAERPEWDPWGKPASIEDDLQPLLQLHHLLRTAGLLRLSRGVLTSTKAAADDQQVIRRLRAALTADSFLDVLIGVTAARLAGAGPASSIDLAEALLPWLDRWTIGGRRITTEDIQAQLWRSASLMVGLDLIDPGPGVRSAWTPGPSATTLLPRATALAAYFRNHADAGA
jgi:hypothetical protein